MKNKKIIIIVIVFLVMFAGAFSVFAYSGRVDFVVTIKDDAFEPALLTVKKNSRVVFKNESSEPRWPASDLHPTHGIYPEFDPLKELAPGEEWAFVFEKPGKWKFHDHLESKIKGIVTVTK